MADSDHVKDVASREDDDRSVDQSLKDRTAQPGVAGWLLRGATVLVTVLVLLLMPLPLEGRATTALGDLVHAPLFGSLALGSLLAWHRLSPPTEGRWLGRAVVVVIGLSVFGYAMEILQGVAGRSASMHDALANMLGAAVAGCFYGACRMLANERKIATAMLFSTSLILLCIAWSRPVALLSDVSKVRTDFPKLASFETDVELTRWYFQGVQGQRTRHGATDGRYALHARYDVGEYSAATLVDMVSDWSVASALEIDVQLDELHDEPTAAVLIKLIDRPHANDHQAAFHKVIELELGKPTRVRIPRSELEVGSRGDVLDLSQVLYFDVGMLRPPLPTVIHIDRLVLATD